MATEKVYKRWDYIFLPRFPGPDLEAVENLMLEKFLAFSDSLPGLPTENRAPAPPGRKKVNVLNRTPRLHKTVLAAPPQTGPFGPEKPLRGPEGALSGPKGPSGLEGVGPFSASVARERPPRHLRRPGDSAPSAGGPEGRSRPRRPGLRSRAKRGRCGRARYSL